ncbi:AGAP010014-PA [Anopheles gambiae str. PEST]|uniref:AGAP010014-PA n=2 Tax=gambiae species complex TaxID=44542 RepID=Q7PM88_ANOGA|nr:AGAP010014-PA [Anopheles gambiae str. PEST]
MRGKKSFDTSLDERWSLDDLNTGSMAKEYPNFLVLDPALGPSMHLNAAPPKRVPNGFMGLRGK